MSMKKYLSRARDNYYKAGVMATMLLFSAQSNATAVELSSIISRTSGQFSASGVAAQTIFAIMGFVLVGFGIFGLATRKDNPQKPVSHSIWFIVCGAFLLIMIAVIRMVTQSTFGQGGHALDRIGLG